MFAFLLLTQKATVMLSLQYFDLMTRFQDLSVYKSGLASRKALLIVKGSEMVLVIGSLGLLMTPHLFVLLKMSVLQLVIELLFHLLTGFVSLWLFDLW